MTALVSTPTLSRNVARLDARSGGLAAVISRARAGDKTAFGELYRACVGRVYALCLRLTQDKGRAEQFTQDAFVRAWEKLDQFRGDAAFTTWLHRLAVNLVLADRRSDGRRRAREMVTANASATVATPHGQTDASLDLERALATLPERCRTVFVLHEIEGMRHEEIAEVLQTAVGTSKSQLHRARSMLKEALC